MEEDSSKLLGFIVGILIILGVGCGGIILSGSGSKNISKKLMILPTSAEAKLTTGDETIICRNQVACNLKLNEKYNVEISAEGFETKTFSDIEVTANGGDLFLLYACLDNSEGSLEVYRDDDIELLKTFYKKCDNGEDILKKYLTDEPETPSGGESGEEFDGDVEAGEEGEFDDESRFEEDDGEEIIDGEL